MVAKKKSSAPLPAKSVAGASATSSSARSTVGGPAHDDYSSRAPDGLVAKMEGAQAAAASMPFNANKPSEYGAAAAEPLPGATVPTDLRATGSPLTEVIPSPKVGVGAPAPGLNPNNLPLDRVRVDSTDRTLTTNQAVPVADNRHSLKLGLRGPALLEDFILREKITHFDHERIPERIVHARGSAELGMELPEPMPRASETVDEPEIEVSPKLSIFSDPGAGGVKARRIAIMVAPGIDVASATALHVGLAKLGAVPRYIGARLGTIKGEGGATIEVEITFETMPSVLFDALIIPDGQEAMELLENAGHAAEFIKGQYRHAKPILALGAASDLVEAAGVPAALLSGAPDPGLLIGDMAVREALTQFVEAVGRHRHHERELDPPAV